MNRFVITVDFKPKSARWRHPASAPMRNAQMSREREPGCRRFAVLVSKGANDRIFFMKSVIAARRSVLTCRRRTSPHDQRRPGHERERC
jgi:hypothetical protein